MSCLNVKAYRIGATIQVSCGLICNVNKETPEVYVLLHNNTLLTNKTLLFNGSTYEWYDESINEENKKML